MVKFQVAYLLWFYLSRTGNGSSWATNSGTGGNFTITGGGLATETFLTYEIPAAISFYS